MKLKGTKTAENLLKAFAGESQARNRYTFYAEKAKEEGYFQIAEIFLETAWNEHAHATRFFSFLADEFEGEDVEITQADYPVGLGDTATNLKYAAAGEHEEWAHLYPAFADVAEEEGFQEVATCFRMVAKAEVNHENRFLKLRENILESKVFEKDEATKWKCIHCGYIHEGKSAPKVCPTCLHKQEEFELFCANY